MRSDGIDLKRREVHGEHNVDKVFLMCTREILEDRKRRKAASTIGRARARARARLFLRKQDIARHK